jgi:hypothetical protein
MICAALMTYALSTAKNAFDLILSIGAGTGLLYLLRWFWWRVNAWSEIAAMISSFVVAVGFHLMGRAGHPVSSPVMLLLSVAITTVVWITTAFLTEPTERRRLLDFYRLVRPAGPGWNDVRAEAGVGPSPDSLPQALLGWVMGIGFVYSALFGTGSFLYGRTSLGLFWLVIFIVTAIGLWRVVPRMWRPGQASQSN